MTKVKKETAPAAPAAAPEVKAAAEVKAESAPVETKAEKVEKKAEKAEKKVEKKTEKKTERKPFLKPAPAKTANVFVQFNGQEWDTAALVEQVKAAYIAEGHRVSSIKELNLYVKPEDGKAYYAINQKITGSVDL